MYWSYLCFTKNKKSCMAFILLYFEHISTTMAGDLKLQKA